MQHSDRQEAEWNTAGGLMEWQSFVFMRSFYDAIELLPEEEQLAAYKAVVKYGLNNEVVDSSNMAQVVLMVAKPVIDSSHARYNQCVENGKKGGRPKKNQSENQRDNQRENQRDNRTETEPKPNQNLNDNVNVNVNVNDKSKRRFTPPSLRDISAYCQERKNGVDPQKFRDHYESNGWMVGKNRMKDWKAAVRTWEHSSNPLLKSEQSSGIALKKPRTEEETLAMQDKLFEILGGETGYGA